MNKNKNSSLQRIAAGILALSLCATASAVPTLTLRTGALTRTISDGGAGDSSATAGVVNFVGVLGVWTLNITTGVSKPQSGTALLPNMDIKTSNRSSGAGELTIEFSDDFFGPTTGNFTAPISGILRAGNGNGIVYSTKVSKTNTEFSGEALGAAQPFTTGGGYNGSVSGSLLLPSAYALTQTLVITHGAQGTFPASTNADAALIFTPGPLKLGDKVWSDTNRNGVQDDGEPGIDGVTVKLSDATGGALGTRVTSLGGFYEFTGLVPGGYIVAVDPLSPALSGNVPSPSGVGSADKDSNGSPATVNLVANDETIDFGYMPPPPTGRIGNFVWEDTNQDGIQDIGEPGIPGVKVILKDTANNPVGLPVITDAGGYYYFTGLAAGAYVVEVDGASAPLAGHVPTYVTAPGSSTDNDSNGSPSATVTLGTDASEDLSVDFGYITTPAGSIGDFVWRDLNGDGLQGPAAAEPGIPGITIHIYGPNGFHDTDVTDADGFYLFTGLRAGSYTIVAPENMVLESFVYNLTTPNALDGGNPAPAKDSNPFSSVVVLGPGGSDTSIDFGYTPEPAGQIGDYVWNDANDNGRQDVGEPGIEGVTVNLYLQGNPVAVATDTTDAFGQYLFSGLSGGAYTVKVVAGTLPAQYIPALSDSGPDDTDSDGSPADVTLAGNTDSNLTIDFGYLRPTGRIGDRVWLDSNENGIQDPGEAGINGVTVVLYDSNNSPIASTVTAGDGFYEFTGLSRGGYSVAVEEANLLVAGYIRTIETAPGSSLENDSNPHPAPVTLLNSVDSNPTLDFGYILPSGRIGNFVWRDSNEDGIQNDGPASGIAGVKLSLFLQGNPAAIATATTGANGEYYFTGLKKGDYLVAVDAANFTEALDGLLATVPNVGGAALDSNVSPAPVSLASHHDQNLTIDFGYFEIRPGSIGDFVWLDLNANGRQDTGEPGIDGVTVKLYAAGNPNPIATVLTQDGIYLFEGLAAGDYTVVYDTSSPALAGLAPTVTGAGSTATDSNSNFAPVHLPLNNSNDTIDFGFVEVLTGQIGNYVWKDLDRDGIQDANEPGIDGVIVNLLDGDGHEIASTTTSGGGLYLFTGLRAGYYTVAVELTSPALSGLLPSPTGAPGSTIANDSNVNPAPVTLPQNDSVVLTIDFGFMPPMPSASGSIGNFVWKDLNGNGRQDSGEPGINGVPLTLKSAAGTVIATTTTAGNGGYLFVGLQAGDYIVEINEAAAALSGLIPTIDLATGSGFNTANDNNPNPAAVTLLTNTSQDLTIDFGFIPPGCACIGDFVWKDLDGDGIQDCNEPGLCGVKVKLYWNGSLIATATTDSRGKYSFRGLWTGCFTVVIDNGQTALSGLIPTRTEAGSNRCYDSNPNPATVCLTSSHSSCSCGNCDSSIDFGFKCLPPPRPLTTYTQGGWGATPCGNNPGSLLSRNFSVLYPNCLIIGGGKTIKFTSSRGVECFLPCGGTAAALQLSYVNPTTKLGVLAGQVVALRLNVDFSNAGITQAGLANAKFKTGKFTGKTVGYVLSLSQSVLGGASLPSGITYTDLSDACALVNENYDEGINRGNLLP